MTIETKYNIGDKVWVMYKDKPTQGTVKWIDIHITGTLPTTISYRVLSYEDNYREEFVFATKEELITKFRL